MLKDLSKYKKALLYIGGGIGLGAGGTVLLGKKILTREFRRATNLIFSEPYDKNIAEFFFSTYRSKFPHIVELCLRAHYGKVPYRPFGSIRSFTTFNNLTFNFAQLSSLPTPVEVKPNLKVVIGPKANRPMFLDNPVIIAGMAYGLALSREAWLALSVGSEKAQVAINSGEGPVLPEFKKHAHRWVQQYARGKWTHEEELYENVDCIEIQLCQGASGAVGHIIPAHKLDKKLIRQLGLKPGEDAVIHARHQELEQPDGLKTLVNKLKYLGGGVPVGVKIGAGKTLKKEMAIAIEAGVDFIAIDGAQAASRGAPPILQDDFGIPTVYALSIAVKFLKEQGVKGDISLIISGGIFTPGDMLKCLALGADAVAIGTAALFAISHEQCVNHTLPFEPPTQLVYYDGDSTSKFNYKQGAFYLENFLKACLTEIEQGVTALGKRSISEVNTDDLCSLDPVVSQITGIPMVGS